MFKISHLEPWCVQFTAVCYLLSCPILIATLSSLLICAGVCSFYGAIAPWLPKLWASTDTAQNFQHLVLTFASTKFLNFITLAAFWEVNVVFWKFAKAKPQFWEFWEYMYMTNSCVDQIAICLSPLFIWTST